MLCVDLHMHTLRSNCGLHTYLEMISEAASKGLKAVAITDHGKALGGPGVSNEFSRRFPTEYAGVKVWKGIEANVLPDAGTDIPESLIDNMDIILLGIHPIISPIIPQNRSEKFYTKLLLDCIASNPFIDILVHLDISIYPVDVRKVVQVAAEAGVAVEFNNSSLMYNKTDMVRMKEMAQAIIDTGCRAVISSDAHSISEIGDDQYVREAFKNFKISGIQIINESLQSAQTFIDERRKIRQKLCV